MMMKVLLEPMMSGMKMEQAIIQYRGSFYPDYPTMAFDFRGDCYNSCFPGSTEMFTTWFGNSVNLRKIKDWGHEWRWRLSCKRNENASIHLRLYHRGEKFCFHFKKKHFNKLRTMADIIQELATQQFYMGITQDGEPMEVIRRHYINEVEDKTTAELLEEVTRRYKAEMPDWPTLINPPDKPELKELAAILAA